MLFLLILRRPGWMTLIGLSLILIDKIKPVKLHIGPSSDFRVPGLCDWLGGTDGGVKVASVHMSVWSWRICWFVYFGLTIRQAKER